MPFEKSYKTHITTMSNTELRGLIADLQAYEPAIVSHIQTLMGSPTEKVLSSGKSHLSEGHWLVREFQDSVLWKNYDKTGILAGDCEQISPGSFSFLINGPCNSAFYEHTLRVSIVRGPHGSGFSASGPNVQVVLWPSGEPIFHANAIGKTFFYHFNDAGYMPVVPGARFLHFATRISVLLANPDPDTSQLHPASIVPTVDEIGMTESVDTYIDAIYRTRTDGTKKFDRDDPCDPLFRAYSIWTSSDDGPANVRYEYYVAAADLTPHQDGYMRGNDDNFLPRRTYFHDDSTDDFVGRPEVNIGSIDVLLFDGTIHNLKDVRTVRNVREAIGALETVGPWTLLSVVHKGVALGYNNPDTCLSALDVKEGDLLVVDPRNRMPAFM